MLKRYENNFVSVFSHDKQGLIIDEITKIGELNKHATAADLGCGIGNYCHLLAELFSKVDVCDLSDEGLRQTKQKCDDLDNINVWQVDLSEDKIPFDPVDFAICINVMIMPDIDQRLRVWRTVTNQIKRGGRLLMVLPSLESIMMNSWQAMEFAMEDGFTAKKALDMSFDDNSEAVNLHQGVHLLDQQPTKHYLKEELIAMLPSHELEMISIDKISYTFESDTDDEVLEAWDWMVCAERR